VMTIGAGKVWTYCPWGWRIGLRNELCRALLIR
jgi:hypothetical protein